MAAASGHSPQKGDDALATAIAKIADAKAAGNDALKAADLPTAIQCYEEGVKLFEDALKLAPQQKELRNNDLVSYGDGKFAIVDTAHPHFGDYILMDLGTRDIVKHKVGKYDHVSTHFKRPDLVSVPKDVFDLRLACLQNLTLVSLKLARASKRGSDFEDTVQRADTALAMDGRAAKALMRKGQACLAIGKVKEAAQALAVASRETRGRDPEVERLLEIIMEAKGKGKGKLKGKGKGSAPEEQEEADGSSPHGPCAACCSSDDSDDEIVQEALRADVTRPAETAETPHADSEESANTEGMLKDNLAKAQVDASQDRRSRDEQAKSVVPQSRPTERCRCASKKSTRVIFIIATVVLIVIGNTLMLRRSDMLKPSKASDLDL